MEGFKHLVSGGWWKGTSEGTEYVCAGKGITQCFTEDGQLRRRLGLTEGVNRYPGSVQAVATKVQKARKGSTYLDEVAPSELVAFDKNTPASLYEEDLIECSSVVSQAGDVCRTLSWVFYDFYSVSSNFWVWIKSFIY